jgi:hypothetical protein
VDERVPCAESAESAKSPQEPLSPVPPKTGHSTDSKYKVAAPSRPDPGPPKRPRPDLQEMVAIYGGYDKITAEDWAEYDRRQGDYQEARRIYFRRLPNL